MTPDEPDPDRDALVTVIGLSGTYKVTPAEIFSVATWLIACHQQRENEPTGDAMHWHPGDPET